MSKEDISIFFKPLKEFFREMGRKVER